jgi:hypothetical protein
VTAIGDADQLAGPPELELSALGLRCRVEARGNLAIVLPAPGERGLEDATVRKTALVALRRCGFTHAAIEVLDECDSGSVSDAPRA